MKTFIRWLIFAAIFIAGFAGIAFYWTFYRPLPDYNTTLKQPYLQKSVNIHWDTYGVPHIYAKNKHDLYYSLGYVHAQDRLWQMTVTQMAAEGRFAEFLGKDLLPFDKLQRTIGFWRTAKKIERTLSDTTRRYLESYSAGVNAYIEQHPKSLPIQFSLAEMKPIPWTVTHSIVLARLMAWKLNISWKSELTYAYLSEQLSPKLFDELLPNNRFLTVQQDSAINRPKHWAKAMMPVVQQSEQLDELMGQQCSPVGSNAWAVSAEKSTTQAPLLAGDPHLGLSIPGTWYEVHLNVDGQNLSGATMPGAPAVVIGQNDQLAWSVTNLMLDDTDFFQEAIAPQDSNQYMLDSLAGQPLYEKFQLQQDVIKIKNADDALFTRRLTNHGPVISNIFAQQKFIKDRVISMKWTGNEVTHEMEALLKMNWAPSFKEFRQAARPFKVPGLNFIYADKSGNIARLSLANIPIRSANPLLLRNGWDPSQDWNGYVPYKELPALINPDQGWVANANNSPVADSYPYYLSAYWEPDSRYRRIRQYLTQNQQLSPEVFQYMQNDSFSMYAQDLSQLILPVLKKHNSSHFKTVISYLENWDYSYEPSETAASIMDVFLLKLSANTFRDEMTEPVYKSYIRFSAMPTRSIMRSLKNDSDFFDDVHTSKRETRADIIVKSMNETIRFLKNNYGSEPFEWRWERLHTVTLKPAFFGKAADKAGAPAPLKIIVNNLLSQGPNPASGHEMSINNGEYSWNDPFKMVLGPSIRQIVDLSNVSRSWSIVPGGQSENPLSQHYDDQTKSWLNGQYKFLYRDSTFFSEQDYKTMKLIPQH